jgi:hypothetical protein
VAFGIPLQWTALLVSKQMCWFGRTTGREE